jgi:serine/threonine protein kinase
MSTFISEPGTRLGGRYRLEDRINASGGWAAWMAIDEILARPVTVLTFAPGFPRIREVVTAARAASRLTDARLAQVFDVEDDWDRAYIVMEWVAGDSLDDLLADGPLDPAHGAEIVAEGAEALAVAHAAGLAHLCLTTDSLRWTPGGGVKVLGLGIDAALSGTTSDDPALTDTRGLAMLLYAALTCHWPGADSATLPPAPLADGRPRSPRQVCAGVPASIDEVACQALFQRERRNGAPLTTPALLADALAEVIPAPLAPPPAAPSAPKPRSAGHAGSAMQNGPASGREYWRQGDEFTGGGGGGTTGLSGLRPPEQRPNRPAANRAVVAGVAVVVLIAIAIGVWSLGRHPAAPASPGSTGGTGSHAPQPSGNAAAAALTPASAHGFDALNLASDPQNENDDEAKFAIDSDPTTAWHTQFYLGSPLFGGLKTGTGLILDMGKAVRLSQVTATFGPQAGADVEIKVGNNNAVAASTLPTFTTVATAHDVGGTYTFKSTSTATGRYVLIWFTKLPPMGAGKFEAEIFNVVVRGSG